LHAAKLYQQRNCTGNEALKDTVDTYRKIFNKALGSQSSTAIEEFIRKYERYKN